jgi:two-component sensor histidine kinase
MATKNELHDTMPHGPLSLSSEADHRIANSLAMISAIVRMRAARLNASDDPRTILLEVADRITTVAELHRVVAHSNDEAVSFGAYLRRICERLGNSLTSSPVIFSFACDAEHIVPPKVALPLGLVVAELYSNSLKYAHPTGLPTKITISCRRSGDRHLLLTYEDDGVGFPEEFDVSQNNGRQGMRLIRMFTEQLSGTAEWDSDPLGMRFEISVPLSSSESSSDAADRDTGDCPITVAPNHETYDRPAVRHQAVG